MAFPHPTSGFLPSKLYFCPCTTARTGRRTGRRCDEQGTACDLDREGSPKDFQGTEFAVVRAFCAVNASILCRNPSISDQMDAISGSFLCVHLFSVLTLPP
jgi:hypothetical protein